MEYKVPPKDSIFNTTFDHLPGFMMFDSSRVTPHSYLELISKCGEGDEVVFSLSVDTLKKMGALEYNKIFHRNDVIKGRFKILKVFKGEEEANADYVKEKSGFSIGGVSPVGWVNPATILIDEALNDYEVVWAAAGHPHSVYPTTFAELLECTGAKPMVVGD